MDEEYFFADSLEDKGERARTSTDGDQRSRIKEVAVALRARDAAQIDLVKLVGTNGQEHFVLLWIPVQLEQAFDLVKVLDYFRKFGTFVFLVVFVVVFFVLFLIGSLFLVFLFFFLFRPDGLRPP